MIRVNPKIPVEYDVAEIEKKLINVARSWADELKDQLIEQFGEAEGLKYYSKYRKSISCQLYRILSPHEGIRRY